jgi:hypothetical protein
MERSIMKPLYNGNAKVKRILPPTLEKGKPVGLKE